jgi:hypothetical protein
MVNSGHWPSSQNRVREEELELRTPDCYSFWGSTRLILTLGDGNS